MSGGKTLIGGTAYTIAGGKTLVSGTAYSIAQGKVMKDGTVYTIDMPHENLVATSVATDGTTIFNGVGYMNDRYLSSGSGVTVPYHCHTLAGYVSTGFIWLPAGSNPTIFIKGATWDTTKSACRMAILAESYLGTSKVSYNIKATNTSGSECLDYFFDVTTLGHDYYKLELNSNGRTYITNADRWYAFSLYGTGTNLVITHNQPIE